MQTYRYLTDYGGGVVVAPCDVAFLAEVAHCNAIGLLPGLTNLGQIGDKRHQATGSDHNPFVQGPSGLWYIRAHDFGGPKTTRQKLNAFWNWRYAQRDPRVYPYGYTNSADPAPYGLTIWFGGGTTRHGTDGDHEHESVNRANTSTVGRAAWTPALDSRAPWGLEAYLRGNAPTEEDDMTDDEMFALLQQGRTKSLLTGYMNAAIVEPHAVEAVARKMAPIIAPIVTQAVIAEVVKQLKAQG